MPSARYDPRLVDWEATTGPRVTDLTDVGSGRIVLRDDGAVLERVRTPADGSAPVWVRYASPAFVVDSVLGGSVRVLEDDPTAQVVLEHVTIQAEGGVGAFGNSLIIRNSRISATLDGLNPTGGTRGPTTIIEDNLIIGDGLPADDGHHLDGIQFWQGGNAIIRRNRITGFNTSALLVGTNHEQQPGDGPVSHLRIEQNWLGNPTGHFTLYLRDRGLGRPRYVSIVDNAFDRDAEPISTGSSPTDQATFVRTEAERDRAVAAGVTDAAGWVVWSGNYWADTGEEIVPPGGWHSG